MKKNYSQRLSALQNRYNPDGRLIFESQKGMDITKLSFLNDEDVYVRTAMAAVDSKYTSDIKQAGENVKTHLQRTLENVVYAFQGSVMTDTHIKGNSDIDLLVIAAEFYNVPGSSQLQELYNKPNLTEKQKSKIGEIYHAPKFTGNSEHILHQNRLKIEETLSQKYKEHDIKKPKCVTIYNSDLRKWVDSVVACFADDQFSILNLQEAKFRGIKIYEKNVGTGKTDHPFYTIDQINSKSARNFGRLKKMIRFLKNFMFDSEHGFEFLKTFDINIICFDINESLYQNSHYIELLFIMQNQLQRIIDDSYYRNNLKSIDGSEKVFYDENGNFRNEKFNEVKILNSELNELLNRIYIKYKKVI